MKVALIGANGQLGSDIVREWAGVEIAPLTRADLDVTHREGVMSCLRALAPDDWRVAANLGTLLVLEGRIEAGRRELERAEHLLGEPLRADDRGPTPYLREAQALLDGELEAFVPELAPDETG